MKIIITGATGFIGQNLVPRLLAKNYELVILTRNLEKAEMFFGQSPTYSLWNGKSVSGMLEYCTGEYAIINLAGENIGKGRWTKTRKNEIIESRVNAGNAVCEAISTLVTKPKVVIQASATGYYNDYSDQFSDENSPPGKRFLSEVVIKWEESVNPIIKDQIRLVVIRSGVVLGKKGGMLENITLPFKLFIGGRIGSGNQWISWIHIDDETDAIVFLLENDNLSGTYNLTAPEPVSMKIFLKTLAKIMKRPYWLPIPAFIIKIIFGEMGKELILSGERVSNKKIIGSGFEYNYPDIVSALKSLFEK